MKRFGRSSAVLMMVCAALAVFAPPASAYSCGSLFGYRGYDFASGVSNANQVQGVITLPAAGSITGVSSSHGPSAADVYMISGSDYVQAGWYVGSTGTGLPYTTTPRFWVGEYYPGKPGNEVLRAGGTLSWGSAHTVRITFSATKGQFQFYLDGIYKFDTLTNNHFSTASPSFDGEIDYACIRMEARAINGTAHSLQYATFGSTGVVWHWFVDQRGAQTANGVTIVSASGGTTATDYSYGGGS